MQKYILLLLACLPLSIINSQPVYQGIVLKDFDRYQAGDTIDVYGSKPKSADQQCFLVGTIYGDTYVGSDKVRLTGGEMDFWENLWFENRAGYIHKNGWELKERKILEQECSTYIQEMEKNNLVFRDDSVEDYFHQLVQMIHPGKLIRPEEKQINILILSAPQPDIFNFNCGTIALTTGKIAEIDNEEGLVRLLSQYITHIVLEDHLSNLTDDIHAHQAADLFTACATIASAVVMGVSNVRNDNDFDLGDVWLVNRASSFISHALVPSTGAYYTSQQISTARHNAAIRVSGLHEQEVCFCQGDSFTVKIAPVLKNLAWQSYDENDYEHSRKILDRLFVAGVEDEEDYLLLAKLYRATAEDESDLQLAFDAITTAEESDDYNFVEVIFEKGMILMKMERYLEAKAAFVEYIAAATEVGGDPDEIEEARKMLMHCYRLLDED